MSDNRPTIGLNLTWLVPGVVGGSEEYTIRLLTDMAAIAKPHARFRAYGRSTLFDRYPMLADLFEPVAMPGRRSSKLRRVVLEQTWLTRVSGADDVVHHLGGTIPMTSRPDSSRPVAVTVHDLQPIDKAENFGLAKRTWLGRAIPLAVERARLIVCPSRFTADRIADRFGVEESKLRVVQQGYRIDPSLSAPSAHQPSRDLTRRLARRRFVLYPAISYRHKRHRDLVDALAALPARLSDVDLVFTGRPGPEHARLDEHIARLGLQSRVHVVGRIPEADLNWLYERALAMAFPSEYEGFGNPCLEAMARGCPVVAADATALPEVIDTAGLLIGVGDVEAWAATIADLADTPSLALDLAARGRVRAAAFDPAIAAERMWAVYRDLLGLAAVADPRPST